MKKSKTCETCMFHDLEGFRKEYPPNVARVSQTKGLCRLHAPCIVVLDHDHAVTLWPETELDDWCGAWQLRMETP